VTGGPADRPARRARLGQQPGRAPRARPGRGGAQRAV